MGLSILLIDDNPDDRALVERQLKLHLDDPRVLHAGTAEAFEHMLDEDFDVAITDYQLRWSDGIAVLQPRVGVPPKTPDRFTRGGLFLPAAGMPRDVGAAGRSRRRSMEGGFPGPPGPAPGRVPRPRGRSEASTDALDWDPHPARVDTQTSPRAEPRSGLRVGSATLTLPDHGPALARMAGSKRMTG